jgi:hypothetical protein
MENPGGGGVKRPWSGKQLESLLLALSKFCHFLSLSKLHLHRFSSFLHRGCKWFGFESQSF